MNAQHLLNLLKAEPSISVDDLRVYLEKMLQEMVEMQAETRKHGEYPTSDEWFKVYGNWTKELINRPIVTESDCIGTIEGKDEGDGATYG